ncbi:MAG: hypothetical protein JKX71_12840 [Amylibacter sp.]|nr:hypothetical protein [Amylibacter sp.]
MKLPPLDKQAHFWSGMAISGTLIAYGLAPSIAILIACMLGALKEVIDPMTGGQRDFWDFAATSLGALISLPLVIV